MRDSIARLLCIVFVLSALNTASATELAGSPLTVDGKPFYPLGGWDDDNTTPELLARLGMNTSFKIPRPTDEGVEQFREHMRACAEYGIQVLPYLPYGGQGVNPWPAESVRRVSVLADEPNLLAWYVGDDIMVRHLEGLRHTVGILRNHTPDVPTAADYIADETPEARDVFTNWIDIRCNYTYPIPNSGYEPYLDFFDRQRAFVGDPLWTWTQLFMWGGTADEFNLGTGDDPGPIPSPEQVRLLAFAAVNRGVRGQLFFQNSTMYPLPERVGEVALFCHEVGLVEAHLVAGSATFPLPASDARVDAAAYAYEGSTVLSAMIVGPDYHRWVDEAVLKNVAVRVPWSGHGTPEAALVAIPETVECRVVNTGDDSITVTIPELEVAGFVLITEDASELEQLREGVADVTRKLAQFSAPAAAAWTSTISQHCWRAGLGDLTHRDGVLVDAYRLVRESGDALAKGDAREAVGAWREALRVDRVALDSMMVFAERRRVEISSHEQRLLHTPFGLASSVELRTAGEAVDPWHFVTEWQLAGPFPLRNSELESGTIPEGFTHAYPPEEGFDADAAFETVDGRSGWRIVETDDSGMMNLLDHFETTNDVVAYARTVVISPETREYEMSLGSNDGAVVFVNGEMVYFLHGGRYAIPHQDTIPVMLHEGHNEVLVKIENLALNWRLYLSFEDKQRQLVFETQ